VEDREQAKKANGKYLFLLYGIIRLKNCFWIELLSPICGAKMSGRASSRKKRFIGISYFSYQLAAAICVFFVARCVDAHESSSSFTNLFNSSLSFSLLLSSLLACTKRL
jgi:hypothetical protein